MTIPGSGQVSFADLRTEFIGGSGQVPLGSLYRGGTHIRQKDPTNPATNDAANVPTSGELNVSDFYNQGKGFTFTYSSGGTDQHLQSLFGATDYAVDYPKNVVIPSGVILGTTQTSSYGLEADTGGAGTITVTNNGNIIGAGGGGGSAGGANSGTGSAGSAGGDAFKAAVAVTFVNNGSLLAGGGGGGGAGGGGQGGALQQQSQQQTTAQQGPAFGFPFAAAKWVRFYLNPGAPTLPSAKLGIQGGDPLTAGQQSVRAQYNEVGAPASTIGNSPFPSTSKTVGQYTYYRGSQRNNGPIFVNTMENPQTVGYFYDHEISRTYPQSQQQQTQTVGGNGGAGGAGGLGRGYQNQPGGDAGSGGSAGTPSPAGDGGAGGTGGTGGGYGVAGNTGNTGTTGTPSSTSGSSGGSGGSGGARGNYIEGISNVTFTNNGTVAGGTQ